MKTMGDIPFDRVVVMDPLALTGEAFCLLAQEEGVARHPGIHVHDIQGLRQALLTCGSERVLVITTLTGRQDKLSEGLAMLESLRWRQLSGQLRVMLCTDLDDGVMLNMMAGYGPAVITLRSDPVAALRSGLWKAAIGRSATWFSPGASEALKGCHTRQPSPRQLEWLVTQVDGMNLPQSALTMRVCDKTAWAWRHTFTKRLGGKWRFIHYIAHLQRRVAC